MQPRDTTRIKAVYLNFGKPRGLRTAGALGSGSPYRQLLSVSVPEDAEAGDALWLSLETWSGEMYWVSVPLQQASPMTASFLEGLQG